MTRLAFGAKCGPICPEPAAMANRSSRISAPKAAAPMPRAVSPNNWRRVEMEIEFVHCFVMVSSRLRITLATVVHAASSAGSSRLSRDDSPTPMSLYGRSAIGRERTPPSLEQLAQDADLPARRRARRRQPERVDDPALVILPAFEQRALRQRAGRLDVGRVVHQRQRLQRRIGQGAAGRALLPIGRVEDRERRRVERVRFHNVYMPRR